MHTAHPILDGPYLRDLFAQPRAMRDTAGGLSDLPGIPESLLQRDQIVLTGMGSSLHALYPLHLRLVAAGKTSLIVETAELLYAQPALLGPQSLVVAVSQSGRSGETVALLNRISTLSRKPAVIGVTNTADSPLAKQADFVVPLRAGEEFTVSCKTYLATLIGLEWLTVALGAGDDAPAVMRSVVAAADDVEAYLSRMPAHIDELIAFTDGMRHLFLTGRGPSLAAVHTGSLILKESTRFHAEGMTCPAFRHGPLEMVGPGLVALVFAGDPATRSLNERLANDITSAGGKAVVISDSPGQGVFHIPPCNPTLRPLLEILPIQMLTLALCLRANRQPGNFERATKVTSE